MVAPFTVRIDRAVTRHEREYMRGDLLEFLRRRMCHELAEVLVDKCQLFDSSQPMHSIEKVSIELTVNDRGSYVNIVKDAERLARREGWESAKRAQPYGLEIDYDC